MIPTFKWNVERQIDFDVKYRVIEVQYGDGYTQSSADGINTKDESYQIRVNARERTAKEIMTFFDNLAGHRSFFWTPPLGELSLFTCINPKPSYQGGGLYVITATFKRSFASLSSVVGG